MLVTKSFYKDYELGEKALHLLPRLAHRTVYIKHRMLHPPMIIKQSHLPVSIPDLNPF